MSEHIISFENVTISQGKKIVLHDVSFTLYQGAFVYLIGRTGTEKAVFSKRSMVTSSSKRVLEQLWIMT